MQQTKKSLFLHQLASAADEICRGEKVECRDFVSVRRLDGKCNNLMNTTSTNWGSSAIAMRRMAPTAYDDGHHTPRKVQLWFLLPWTFFLSQVNITPRNVSDAMHKMTGVKPRLNRQILNSQKNRI